MSDLGSLPAMPGSKEGPTPASHENGKRPNRYWRMAAMFFLLMSLAFVIAILGISYVSMGALARMLAEAVKGGTIARLDPIAGPAAAIGAGFALLVGCWHRERSRAARARERDAATRRRLTARIHFLTQHVNDCIILCDASGRIIEANGHCLDTYGYSQEEWLRLDMNGVMAEGRFALPALVQQLPEERGISYASRHVRKDGTVLDVELCASLTELDDQPCYQLVVRDVSEKRSMEKMRGAYAQHLKELARRLVTVQEEERQRLAEELHDQVGANLATINLNLRSIRKLLPNPDPHLLEARVKDAGTLLADTIFSIRNACAELRPAILQYSGLVLALQELTQRAGGRGDMEVRFRSENMHERLAPQAEAMLFRIAQEALTNCAKHSNASRADLVIARQAHAVVMTVSDNGNGFDTKQPGAIRAGLGLLTMRERAALAGGTISIVSSPGKGTHVRVVVSQNHEQHCVV